MEQAEQDEQKESKELLIEKEEEGEPIEEEPIELLIDEEEEGELIEEEHIEEENLSPRDLKKRKARLRKQAWDRIKAHRKRSKGTCPTDPTIPVSEEELLAGYCFCNPSEPASPAAAAAEAMEGSNHIVMGWDPLSSDSIAVVDSYVSL